MVHRGDTQDHPRINKSKIDTKVKQNRTWMLTQNFIESESKTESRSQRS